MAEEGREREDCLINFMSLPVPPGANRIWRVAKGRTYINPDYGRFKGAVKSHAMLTGQDKPGSGTVMVLMIYHPKARKKETEKPMRRLDCDAIIKPVLDSLIGIAYHDDYQVHFACSFVGAPDDEGRVDVYWREVPSITGFLSRVHSLFVEYLFLK